ncbi:MAG: hypothetical protein JWO80_5841 [Bryobacterales bacterium]|jgi:hypothetical protein|nr:hypothetical protein [Bryobacterales bacterium]
MKAENYNERRIEIDGWPVRITSYKLGERYVCEADNVSPGAILARIAAPSAEDAEKQAISKATHLLGKTKRHEV